MALTGFMARVATIALTALQQDNFALGGGFALQAHGLVERPSDDLDAYQPNFEREPFDRGQARLIIAFTDAGMSATVDKELDVFRRVTVTDRKTGESLVIDLGYDSRHDPPVTISGLGPVASVDDSVGTKARALNDRRAARDYFDLNSVLQQPHWSPERVYRDLLRFRKIEREEFARDLRAAHEEDPSDYAAYGMTFQDMDSMFDRLSRAADQIEARLETTKDASQDPTQRRKPKGAPQSSGGQFLEKNNSLPEVPLLGASDII